MKPFLKLLLILAVLVAVPGARAQTILGKSPADKAMAAFFGQNGNADTIIDGLNNNATHGLNGSKIANGTIGTNKLDAATLALINNGGGGGGSGSSGETNSGVNLGNGGVGIYVGKAGAVLQFLSFVGLGGAVVVTNQTNITISADAAGSAATVQAYAAALAARSLTNTDARNFAFSGTHTYTSGGVILPASPNSDTNAAISAAFGQQMILSSTVDFGAIAPASGVIGLGLDSGTNVIVLHIRSNLTATATGTNGHYWLDAANSGGGGGGTSSGIVSSNYFVTTTNRFLWDLNKVQHLVLKMETNLALLEVTNIWAVTNYGGWAQYDRWQDTNGTRNVLAIQVDGGLARTNGNLVWAGTNASQYDISVCKIGSDTNFVFSWETNDLAGLSFTNSLATGGGGGGGGGWTLIATAATNALLAAHETLTTATTNTVGGNLNIVGVEWYNNTGPLPYDNQNNSYTNSLLLSYGDASGNHSNQIYYAISPTENASHSFSITNTTAGQMYCGLTVQVWQKSGTPALDTATGTNYVSGGGNTTSLASGVVNTFGVNELVISAATWNNSGVTAASVSPGFTITDQRTLGDPTASGGIAYTNMAVQASVSPVWHFSGNANALSGSTAAFK